MKEETRRLLAIYGASADMVAEAFARKQFCGEGDPAVTFEGNPDMFWVADDPGGVLCFGDYSYGFGDILTDLREDAPAGEIDRYNDYVLRCMDNGLRFINYRSWLHGAPRHSEEDFGKLEWIRQRMGEETERVRRQTGQ